MSFKRSFRLFFVFALLFQLVAIPMVGAEENPEATAEDNTINYLALGDSLAFGINSDGVPAAGYADFIAQGFLANGILKSFNKGFSFPGYTAGDVLNDLKNDVTKPTIGLDGTGESAALHESIPKADLLTISAGANDVLKFIDINPETGELDINMEQLLAGLQQVGVHYNQILQAIYQLNPDVQVYVMEYYNPFPHLASEMQPQLEQLLTGLNGAIKTGLTGTDAVLVPTKEAIAANFQTYLPNPQNIHLSEAGYKVVAAQFMEKIVANNAEPAPPVEPEPIVFSDIAGHGLEAFIEQAAAAKIVNGYSDGTFKPENKLTRTQAASIIVRALQLQPSKPAPFKDLRGMAPETQAEIAAAYEFGIVKGSNGKFNPGAPVTRAQLALMVKRSYEFLIKKHYQVKDYAPFSDISKLDSETKIAITLLYDFELAEGSKGRYMPHNSTTRAQASKILVNYMNNMIHIAEDLPEAQ